MILLNPATSTPFPTQVAQGGTTMRAPIGRLVLCKTSAGPITVQRPSPRPQGTVFAVLDVDGSAGTNPITIDGDGDLLDGLPFVQITEPYQSLIYVYDTDVSVPALPPQWRRVVGRHRMDEFVDDFELETDAAPAPTPVPAPSAGALLQQFWRINALTGLDTNTGLPGAPLKTFAELSRRWGVGNTLNPGAGLAVVVGIETDLPSSDPVTYHVRLGPSVGLLVQGRNTTALQSGAFTAVTAKNRATNTPLQATDVAVNWADFLATGATPGRIHDTVNDSYFWPAVDQGGGSARLSEPFKNQIVPNGFPGLGPGDRPGAPVAIGDAFTIERLTQVYVGGITVDGSDSTGNFFFTGNNVAFQDLWITEQGFLNNIQIVTGGGCAIKYYGCIIGTSLWATPVPNGNRIQNCNTGKPFFGTLIGIPGGECQFLGGLVNAITLTANGIVFADLDVLFQSCGPGFAIGSLIFGTVAVFDTPGGFLPNNTPGDGIHLGAGCGLRNQTFSDSTHAIWGSGNAGAGIGVGPGGTFAYETNAPTITGSTPGADDFTVGGKTTSRAWDDAGAGAWSALPIANSWANLVAAIPAGLGDAATDVATSAKVCKGA